jgi:hypothetical protein
MADKIRIELNEAGVRALLKSPEMMAICQQHASDIASRAGDGYVVSTYTGRNRVNASVGAETAKAKRDNMKNNTLLKAVRG